jgi:hypothetical protein
MNVSAIHGWLHHPITSKGLLRWWSSKREISWRDYLFAALLAYLLAFLALAIEWCLTWHNQVSMVRHFGLPNIGNIMGWMTIPALLSYLVYLRLMRYLVRCRVAAIFLCVVWIIILLTGEEAVH